MPHPPICDDRARCLLALLQRLGLEPPAGSLPHVLQPLDEALTHTSAGLAFNHEQLEFLGDAVLRLAASEYIEREHSQLSVGERSALRSHLVSDRWLAELGETIGIDQVLRIGATARGDHTAGETLRAEACEALIGGLYKAYGGLEPVHRWLTPEWQRTSTAVLADPHRGNSKSALQEWTQGRGLGLPSYTSEERSRQHADPRRFHCRVELEGCFSAEGWGRSRREAEQKAAAAALEQIRPARGC
jgi:ribonuclease-3